MGRQQAGGGGGFPLGGYQFPAGITQFHAEDQGEIGKAFLLKMIL